MIRPVSSTRVSRETHAARSTSTKEKKLTSPPSRSSLAKRSPSTVLASRSLRRQQSPKGIPPLNRSDIGVAEVSFRPSVPRLKMASVPSVLVRSRRCSRTPPLPHGSINTNEKEDKEKMTDREQYAPGPARGAAVRKDGEKWTL